MATETMNNWTTAISKVVSDGETEDTIIRGHSLNELIGQAGFAEIVYLLLTGRRASPDQNRVLNALLVACIDHGIAPPSMIARCFASYGTNIQQAVGG